MQIYLDLDGVFADFFTFSRYLLGFDYHENPKLFWEKVSKVPRFFQTLNKMDGSQEIYELVRDFKPKILTALPILTGELITAPEDKRVWVHNHISPELEVITTKNWSYKKEYAVGDDGCPNILVDDSYRNIVDWQVNGGVGVYHTSVSGTVRELKNLLFTSP